MKENIKQAAEKYAKRKAKDNLDSGWSLECKKYHFAKDFIAGAEYVLREKEEVFEKLKDAFESAVMVIATTQNDNPIGLKECIKFWREKAGLSPH